MVAPTGDAATCSISTRVPTLVDVGSRLAARAATVAASSQAMSRGVASTGTSPLPRAIAVSASVTSKDTAASSPTCVMG
jgi:hypothetical protein